MVRFFWGPFSLFLILKGTCSFGWFTVAIQVSSLKWARILISRKKFCKSEDNWFLLCLFLVGMTIRFLFRSLWISKQNDCFDKFTTFPDGSDLYPSAFIIVRCSLKVFALFLERNSVPLTDLCWFEYGLLRQRPPGCFFGSGCSSLFSVCLGYSCISLSFWFCFNSLIWFFRSSISSSLSFDVCFVVEGTLLGDFPRRCGSS